MNEKPNWEKNETAVNFVKLKPNKQESLAYAKVSARQAPPGES